MRIFNDSIENSVGVSSIDQGEYIGVGYTIYLPPTNGLIIQGFLGLGTFLPSQSLDINGNVRYRGALYDINNVPGINNQVLVSTGAGVTWTTQSGGGNISGNIASPEILFATGSNTLTGVSTFVYYQGNIGIGTSKPLDILHISNSFGTTVFYVSLTTGFVGIYTNLPTYFPPETLSVRQYINNISLNTSFTLFSGISSVNNYSQLIIYNLNPGNFASADFIIQANIGNENSFYVDLGINNSGYNASGLYGNALDGYLYSLANNFWIGNASSSLFNLYFFTGGGIFTQQTRMTITGFGSIGINTLYPAQTLDINGSVIFRNVIYDINNTVGSNGQVLSSTGTGVAWTTSNGITGSIIQNQVAYGASTNMIQGSNNLWFTGTALGIGTSSMISRFVVQSQGVSSSVLRIQGFSGTLFEIFDSVTGILNQVSNVSGLPVLQVNDGISNPNAIIYSGGIGQTIAILSIQTSGSIISSFSTSVAYFSQKLGINTNIPTQYLDINGQTRLRSALYDTNNVSGQNLGIVTQYLASYNGLAVTWMPVKRFIDFEFFTGYGQSNLGINSSIYIFPYDFNDGLSLINYTIKRITVRVENPSLGFTTINISKYSGTGQFSGTNIITNNITVGATVYEGFATSINFTGFGATAVSNDKLAVNFIGNSQSPITIFFIARET